ncbi:CidA/LrgA family protein [Acinetobacter sp. ANC 3813]|uniref:CidA/LrgA family protein n=1 Tax=Acinetobacter sp. ANC 3813 TaxID=1977873 RepID=UPI000A3517A5|nr:CidA/LrgA family protein [Acinetobacter sp. ANC 3813]OTG88851.1 CidA/LrgA family protein [Acinetobacter sp. ANC 3813]
MFRLPQSPHIMYLLKTTAQLGLLILIWSLGSFIQQMLKLPISAGVIGLLLLTAALISGIFKLEWIKQGSDLLLAELVLFFVPIVVGLIKYKELLLTQGWQLALAVVAGTICVMICTAYCVYWGFKLEAKLKNRTKPESTSTHEIIQGK